MSSWVDDLLAMEPRGIIRHGEESSFALRALAFVRWRWVAEHRGKSLPLETANWLLNNKLRWICTGQTITFCCGICRPYKPGTSKYYTFEEVLIHIHADHRESAQWTELFGGQRRGWNSLCNPSAVGGNWPECLPVRPSFKRLGFSGTEVISKAQQIASANRYQLLLRQWNTHQNLFVDQGKLPTDQHWLNFRVYVKEAALTMERFSSTPSSHQLLLWFRLSIGWYKKAYGNFPGRQRFVMLAATVQRETKHRMFDALQCGVCGARGWVEGHSWDLETLEQHFRLVHSKAHAYAEWTERMILFPSRELAYRLGLEVMDGLVKREWIELWRIANKGMMADTMMLELGDYLT